jgi:hypothetical protein
MIGTLRFAICARYLLPPARGHSCPQQPSNGFRLAGKQDLLIAVKSQIAIRQFQMP